MNIILITGFIALSLAVLLWVLRSAAATARTVSTAASKQILQPVSVTALSRVLDDSDEAYWRGALTRSDLRAARRMRIDAAMEYISRIRCNAVVLLELGQSARRSSDPAVARRGEDVVEVALQLRLHSFLALYRLRLAMIFPSLAINRTRILPDYTRLQALADGLQSSHS